MAFDIIIPERGSHKEGYVFRKWNIDISHVIGDMAVTALYDEAELSCLDLNIKTILLPLSAFLDVFFRRRRYSDKYKNGSLIQRSFRTFQ
jgi:hypothetical protein